MKNIRLDFTLRLSPQSKNDVFEDTEYILEIEAKKVAQINDAFAKPIARFYFAKNFEERRVVRLSYDDL